MRISSFNIRFHLEKARLILPQIIDNAKETDQGRINVAEMRRLLKIPHNTAYNLRRELLKEYNAQKGSRGTVAKPSIATKQPSSQQEEKTA